MKSLILLLFFNWFYLKSYSQVKFDIDKGKYKGNIIKNDSNTRDFLFLFFDNDSFELYTPKSDIIYSFEYNLKKKLKKANKKRECQNGITCPIIHRNLPKYYRKYAGVVNKKTNQRFLIVSFKLKKYVSSNEMALNKKFYNNFDDGCSQVFLVLYDIENNRIAKLFVDCEK